MKLRKYIRKYIICLVLVCLVFTINVVPISAVVASGGLGSDYTLTQRSTFPLTVGFAYRSVPSSASTYPNYVFANDFGGFGQEYQVASNGQDFYEFNYQLTQNGDLYSGQGVYYYHYIDTEYPERFQIDYRDGNFNSVYKLGFQRVRLNNSAFFSENYDPEVSYMNNSVGLQQGMVFRARDVYYNTHWLYDNSGRWIVDPLQSMLPCVSFMNNDNIILPGFETDDCYFVYEYEYSATLILGDGSTQNVTGSYTFNTLTDPTEYRPIIPLAQLQPFVGYGKTILISDYYGTLFAKYYERDNGNVINGVWQIKSPSENYPLFGADPWGGALYSASCDVVASDNVTSSGLQAFNTMSGSGELVMNIANGGFIGANITNFCSQQSSEDSPTYKYFGGANQITISNWDYANNANVAWYAYLNYIYTNVTPGSGNPSASDDYREKPISGMGMQIDLTYPLYDTSGVVLTGSEIYQDYYGSYGLPTANKYIDTYGTYNPPPDDFPSYSGAGFSDFIVEAVGGFTAFELWDGFSIASVLTVCIAIPLVLWVLKLFAGG